MSYIFFDAETTGFPPDGKITCLVTEYKDRTKVWASRGRDNTYVPMEEACVEEVVTFMEREGDRGQRVVSYNGSSFDFQMLWNQTRNAEIKARICVLAKNHIDLHLVCIRARGHRMKMDGLAKASLGLVKIGTGKEAILLWESKQYKKLFEYCTHDVLILRDLFNLAKNEKSLQFESSKGNLFTVDVGDMLEATASELSKQKPHKESWMKDNSDLMQVFSWLPE